MKREKIIVNTEKHAEWKHQVGWDNLSTDQRINLLESEGMFDVDVLDDPPTYQLMPNEIDYEQKKLTTKIKSSFANWLSQIGINRFINNGMFSIKEIKGIENWQNLKTSAILTCNHFGATDSFIMQKVMKACKKKKLFRVVREGNYTNPSVLKFFLRNCGVLPLSSNMQTMKNFLRAVDNILKRGDDILVYPEESMWPDYRKPKPLKDGAFRFAIKNNVPVLPIFITMEDVEFYDKKTKTSRPMLAHTAHILEPIYSNPELSMAENIEYLKNKNYDMWVKVYEDFYGKKLEYITKNNQN